MSRRRPRRGYGGGGLASHSYENECPRCGRDITDWRTATKVRGTWIHKTCAGGADDR
ncbi:MAG: hypothetical protein ACI379_01340 [Nocardioides sp.]|uniref:hypothetical protein n=1 Tax=Nocardioides sp. TaxID=35761 RepID=UPI003EFC06DF